MAGKGRPRKMFWAVDGWGNSYKLSGTQWEGFKSFTEIIIDREKYEKLLESAREHNKAAGMKLPEYESMLEKFHAKFDPYLTTDPLPEGFVMDDQKPVRVREEK